MSRRAAVATVVLFAVLVGACSPVSKIALRAAGHEITAEIEGKQSVESLPTHAIVGSEFGKVTIEETRVRVEGLNWTQIPAGVPVKVSIKRGKLQVVAGSVRIGRTISNQ